MIHGRVFSSKLLRDGIQHWKSARSDWKSASSRSDASQLAALIAGTSILLCLSVAPESVSPVRRKDFRSSFCNDYFSTSKCDAHLHEFDEQHPTGYTETERFLQCLEYHRSLLFDYSRRWDIEDPNGSSVWPRNIPQADEIPALELDLKFCKMSPNYRNNRNVCQNQQFRIAAYYVTQKDDTELQMRGYKLVKDLAEHGHPDGMCLYAIILTDGRVTGVDDNPEEAVVWFRRCVDLHRHLAATYELAIAYYTGDGVAENPEAAVKLFRQAAHLGHAGAAYMLGECLLDGVGSKRDRANALEWLVTAAELGHQLARHRVLVVLQKDYEDLDEAMTLNERDEEALKWVNQSNEERVVLLERRHTVGGTDRNPVLTARRRTKVLESRGG